jgi:hypothetical protein
MSVYTLKRESTTTDRWPEKPESEDSDHRPMPYRLHVCRLRVFMDEQENVEVVEYDECHEKAIADGYEYRPDLTLTR